MKVSVSESGATPVDVAVADVLTAYDVVRLDRQHRAEDLVLLLADGSRLEGGGRLHRGEREHLEQVGDHHVAVGAGRLVEVGALGESQLLGHVDLDVADVVAVPDRLEETVGEPEREDVLRRLLAQEVVDPEDLLLVEDLVQLAVELLRRRQVGPERLLHDDAAALDEIGVAEQVHHGQRRLRRHAQVVQPPQLVGAELRLGLGDGLAQRLGAAGSRCPAQPLGELVPPLRVRPLAAELGDRRCGPARRRSPGRARPARCRRPAPRSSSPDWNRCSRPGSSLRWARSPVAPNRTTVVGVGMGPASTAGRPLESWLPEIPVSRREQAPGWAPVAGVSGKVEST